MYDPALTSNRTVCLEGFRKQKQDLPLDVCQKRKHDGPISQQSSFVSYHGDAVLLHHNLKSEANPSESSDNH